MNPKNEIVTQWEGGHIFGILSKHSQQNKSILYNEEWKSMRINRQCAATLRKKKISQEFQLHIGVEEEPAQILEQDTEIPELFLVLWENQSANGFGRTEAAARNYRTAYCNDLNTGLKHQGQKPRGNTGDDVKEATRWEMVVANVEKGRIKIIQAGQKDRSLNTESQKQVQSQSDAKCQTTPSKLCQRVCLRAG